MSVTAHLTEMYLAKYKLAGLNFRWLLVGCYFPDGMGLSKLLLIATGDKTVHRDVLFGWTHALPVCALAAVLVGTVFGRRAGLSFGLASILHVLMDLGDPVGEKLLFPFSDRKFSLGLWPWTDGPILDDLLAYYSAPVSLGVEAVCLVGALYACGRLTGTLNPVKATIELWRGSGWSDAPARAPAAPALVGEPTASN